MRTFTTKNLLLVIVILFGLFIIMGISKSMNIYEGNQTLADSSDGSSLVQALKAAAPGIEAAVKAAAPALQQAAAAAAPSLKQAATAAAPALQEATDIPMTNTSGGITASSNPTSAIIGTQAVANITKTTKSALKG